VGGGRVGIAVAVGSKGGIITVGVTSGVGGNRPLLGKLIQPVSSVWENKFSSQVNSLQFLTVFDPWFAT
jgi:hypothetical protein